MIIVKAAEQDPQRRISVSNAVKAGIGNLVCKFLGQEIVLMADLLEDIEDTQIPDPGLKLH